MDHDIERILIPREQIAARVHDLAREIVLSYPNSQDRITIVTILSGSIIFLADLIRQMPIKMEIGLVTVSSYSGATTESRGARLMKDLSVDIRDRDVLIVDDIFDTGGTLRLVKGLLGERRPRSLKTAVLLRKLAKNPPDVSVEFVGFDIEDRFVVGYGLDFNDQYRNYPHIAVLKPEMYATG
jgi:hypoxanthine phosphoribosyltransferase